MTTKWCNVLISIHSGFGKGSNTAFHSRIMILGMIVGWYEGKKKILGHMLWHPFKGPNLHNLCKFIVISLPGALFHIGRLTALI